VPVVNKNTKIEKNVGISVLPLSLGNSTDDYKTITVFEEPPGIATPSKLR
jgi:hypothetical protein